MTINWKRLAQRRFFELHDAMREIDRLQAALSTIHDIASGSTTSNSLPHIAKLAQAALTPDTGDQQK